MPNLPFRPPPGCPPPHRRGGLAQAARARPAERRLRDVFGRMPWLLLSTLIHAILLAILARVVGTWTLPVERPPGYVLEIGLYPEQPQPVAELARAPEPPPKLKPPPRPPEPKGEEPDDGVPTRTPAPAPPVEAKAEKPPETPQVATAKGTPVVASPGHEAPARDLFASRRPAARGEALRRWGGTPASERAVDNGLAWLSAHQASDGSWSDGDPQLRLRPGLTALAALAFLGKGHSHTARTKYRDNVARALRYLLSIQSAEGRFGEPYIQTRQVRNRYLMYHQALATMALSEAYAMTGDTNLAEPVRRGVAFIQRAQQDAGGWDYGDAPTGRNDTSVTGWQLMALKSAHAAGIAVDWQALFGIMRHLDLNTGPSGQVVYANKKPGAWRRGPGMAAVGMFCYLALGWPRDCPLIRRQADLLLRNPPDWADMNRNDPRDPPSCLHTMYYWYYATLALFQMGGHWWEEWNPRIRDLLIERQRNDGQQKGSWDPPDRGFDATGGRVYATAINVLTLEIYYRYLPFYQAAALDAVAVLRRAARVRSSDATRRRALGLLVSFAEPRAQDILVDALGDPDPAVRATAQRVLVQQKSERVVPHLLKQLESVSALARLQAVSGLAAFGQPRFAHHLIKALEDPAKMVRERAVRVLRKLTGRRFGFEAGAPPERRAEAVALWQRWARGQVPEPPPEGISATVLVVDQAAPNSVVLDVGRKHTVHRGMRFEIVRRGKVVAVVEAEKVEATLTVARVVERRGGAIREGDGAQSLPRPERRAPEAAPGASPTTR